MSEQKENNIMASSNENYQNTEGKVEIIENETKICKNNDTNTNSEIKKERASSDTTILHGSLMITNLCLGVTIFTFAVRIKYFGLVWFVLSCVLVGAATYWSIIRGVIASSKMKKTIIQNLLKKYWVKK